MCQYDVDMAVTAEARGNLPSDLLQPCALGEGPHAASLVTRKRKMAEGNHGQHYRGEQACWDNTAATIAPVTPVWIESQTLTIRCKLQVMISEASRELQLLMMMHPLQRGGGTTSQLSTPQSGPGCMELPLACMHMVSERDGCMSRPTRGALCWACAMRSSPTITIVVFEIW